MFEYTISTITATASLYPEEQNLNLIDISRTLEIDDFIRGIKFTFGETSVIKGSYETSVFKRSKHKKRQINAQGFYNQISLVVSDTKKEINVKLFGNGTLHLTGLVTPDSIDYITQKLRDAIKKCIEARYIPEQVKNSHGIVVDKDNLIYSEESPWSCIGFVDNSSSRYKYSIDKKMYEYDSNVDAFVAQKSTKGRSRVILDKSGKPIGRQITMLNRGKNRLYANLGVQFKTKDIDTDENGNKWYPIVYSKVFKDEIYLGRVTYEMSGGSDASQPVLSKGTSINCINIYFSIGFQINRKKFFNVMSQEYPKSQYNPEKYSGVKVILPQTTLLVFQSGNVLATGFKSLGSIKGALSEFEKVCLQNKHRYTVAN